MSRSVGRTLAGYAISGALAAWAMSLLGVVAWGARDMARPADAIVVLGAAQYAGRPSPVLKARLDHAVDLWKRGMATFLVLTGGRGPGDTTSEADVGRRYVLRAGVADSVILLENRGRTTSASIEAVARIMNEKRLDEAILVSDPFHMLRLQILAKQHGVPSVTSPTRTSPISANRLEAAGYILSESVKVPATLVLGLLGR
ncbi:MAG: YdcF family protein [Gemmatimonadaceae bacterium]|nr:YdcF family protein [Gemmatimonadaceae bacterium]